jgi:hypothetical protein
MANESPRVVDASLRSFVCAYPQYVEEPFRLGQLVVVREGRFPVFGVVADVASGPEDPTRPLQPPAGAGDRSAAEVFAGEPHVRLLLRTRVTVVSCAYVEGEACRAAPPPLPPPLFALVEAPSGPETVAATGRGGFLAALAASPLCDDTVIAATLRLSALAHGPAARTFVVDAGKELARLLKAEPARLASILRGVAS